MSEFTIPQSILPRNARDLTKNELIELVVAALSDVQATTVGALQILEHEIPWAFSNLQNALLDPDRVIEKQIVDGLLMLQGAQLEAARHLATRRRIFDRVCADVPDWAVTVMTTRQARRTPNQLNQLTKALSLFNRRAARLLNPGAPDRPERPAQHGADSSGKGRNGNRGSRGNRGRRSGSGGNRSKARKAA